jgi:hypothetical protein
MLTDPDCPVQRRMIGYYPSRIRGAAVEIGKKFLIVCDGISGKPVAVPIRINGLIVLSPHQS